MPLPDVDGIITDSQIPREAAAEMGEGIVHIVEEKDAAVTRFWFKEK
jgi:hypothetical protein